MRSRSKYLDFAAGAELRRPAERPDRVYRRRTRILFLEESAPLAHHRSPVFPLYLTGAAPSRRPNSGDAPLSPTRKSAIVAARTRG